MRPTHRPNAFLIHSAFSGAFLFCTTKWKHLPLARWIFETANRYLFLFFLLCARINCMFFHLIEILMEKNVFQNCRKKKTITKEWKSVVTSSVVSTTVQFLFCPPIARPKNERNSVEFLSLILIRHSCYSCIIISRNKRVRKSARNNEFDGPNLRILYL